MKKQDKKDNAKQVLSKTEKLEATIKQLRNENHNLKRRLKRSESKLQEKLETTDVVSAIDGTSKVEEVEAAGIADIKKNFGNRV